MGLDTEKVESAKSTKKSIPVRERAELRRILKQRFELLQGQLVTRRREIEAKVQTEVEKDFAPVLAEYVKKGEKIIEEYDAVKKKWYDLLDEAAKKEVEPQTSWIDFTYYGRDERVKFRPSNMQKRVAERLAEVRNRAGYKDLDLRTLQLNLEERLALDAIESEEARKFFAQIPTVDQLLPLPNGDKPHELEK